MNATKIIVTIAILGIVLAGGGYYYFLHKTEVQVEAPPAMPAPAVQAPRAPDYGRYATAKHPTFPGTGKTQPGSNSQ